MNKNGGGGRLSALKFFFNAGTYIASLYYYPVLGEHSKKWVLCPLPPFGGNSAGYYLRGILEERDGSVIKRENGEVRRLVRLGRLVTGV